MRPTDHVIYGAVGAAALYPAIGAGSLLFWAASVAIDLDHYIDYVWHNRFTDLGYKGMFEYHRLLTKRWHNPAFLNIEIFHTIEFIVPLLIITHYTGSAPLLAVCMGFIFHIALDLVSLRSNGIFFARAHSFPEYFIRKKMLESRGLDPAGLYTEAARMTREGFCRDGR
ncbi:MAG: hypothetical protein IT362_01320 [Deltaproteobacteria bacterium]|nr:hypothetical protein [Deltaproteobacteria bacterium]